LPSSAQIQSSVPPCWASTIFAGQFAQTKSPITKAANDHRPYRMAISPNPRIAPGFQE
jgi:hypothetical protein